MHKVFLLTFHIRLLFILPMIKHDNCNNLLLLLIFFIFENLTIICQRQKKYIAGLCNYLPIFTEPKSSIQFTCISRFFIPRTKQYPLLSIIFKYIRLGVKITHFFTNCFNYHFAGIPLECHPAVPVGDVLWLEETIVNEGITFEEAILLLQKKMFPEDYEPCAWVEGDG